METPPAETGRPVEKPAARRRGRWLALPVVALALSGLVWAGGRWYRRGPAPQGEAFPEAAGSPFLNTRAGVEYVGDQRCAECHPQQALAYREHPMGRSVSPATHALPGQRRAPPTFTAGGLRYAVERAGGRVLHRETCPTPDGAAASAQAEAVAWAVGSGRQGQTFLLDRGGYLFQSPVSWYARRQAWDLSPGYESDNHHFNRPILEVCLYCHTNGARAEPGSVNRYARPRLEPVGCERCHGPGQLHVAARLSEDPPAGPDYTIVNPKHLGPALREAVCQQCHLQGEARVERRGRSMYDYRPGLALEEFVAVFVRPPGLADGRKAVSHAEQMHQSACFRGSGGGLGCTSCHDPHELPAERSRVGFYRGRCLGCHAEHGCALAEEERRRRSPQDSCIDCHMPRGGSSNIAHLALTDHRVVRRPGQAGPAEPAGGRLPLVDFHRGPASGGAGESRDLGVALAELAGREGPLPDVVRAQMAFAARGLLEPAVRSDPDDVRGWEALGYARWKAGSPHEALAALEGVLARAPRREEALEHAARVAMGLNDLGRSERYWRRLVEANPWRWHAHAYLGQILALRGRWPEAADACRKSLALSPLEERTRMLLIRCLLRAGQPDEARAEQERLLALRPGERERLGRWFEEETRAAGEPR
jgi:cytochrome c-type biogenesis protein CcmH/NrfG